jgi:RNA polymerase sigma-70 factor (ECF subfamily)
VGADVLDSLPTLDESPEAAIQQTELTRLVRTQLTELPDKYRLPLMYAAIDGFDYETVGALVGVPVGTAKTLVFRAKQMLKARVLGVLRAGCLV